MRYRQLGPADDYTIGLPFYVNSPIAVAQAVYTRLKLLEAEWFLDVTDGTPYSEQILGKHYGSSPDAYIKQRILNTPGVTSIVSYLSAFNGNDRSFTVSCTLATEYGETSLTVSS